MLGRGTRLCPEIHKSKFTIFDCFDGTLIEYFRNTTDFNIESPQKEPVPLSQVIENIYQNIDRDYYTRVLIKRLQEWKTEVLNELREKLKRNRFAETELQKAHNLVYNKALADIISMVKHAARQEEPVLTAEERVDQAIQKVRLGKSFNEEQDKWLGFIRDHLVQNLTIDLDDFEKAPIFEQRGGLTRARKVFSDTLAGLIAEINYAMAA
jgi:type I restriction enzyme R subunit